jgi:hypothetical protein
MKKTGKILTVTLLAASCLTAAAQTGMGEWRTHFSYNSVKQLAQSENRIFALSDGALFSVDKRDQSIALYSKITGLNDNAIQNIAYDNATEQLLIIYGNGNMDLMNSKGIVNISDFYLKQSNILKSVNHILFADHKAYLSTDFGILVLDLDRNEVKDTYYIGANSSAVKVLATTIFDGKIFAASADSVYFADLNSNLVNYQYWAIKNDIPGTGKFQSIAAFAEKLFVLRAGILHYTDGVTWTLPNISSNIKMLKVADNRVYAIWDNWAGYFDNSFSSFTGAVLQNYETIYDFTFESSKRRNWFATGAKGLATQHLDDEIASYFKPEGPAINSTWNLTFAGEKLFAVPGGRAASQYNVLGNMSIFVNNQWKNITQAEIIEQTQKPVKDFINTAIDPNDD